VDADLCIARLTYLLKQLTVMALSSLDYRREQHKLFPLEVTEYGVENLVLRLSRHLLAAEVGVRFPCAGKKQSHEVIDFRYGADSRARVSGGRLLFDRNDRAKAIDLIDIRSLKVSQKAAGVRGKAFHIPPLPFGVNGIKRQRGLAASADAGNDHQFVAGEGDVDVFEVMFPGADDLNLLVPRRIYMMFSFCCRCCTHGR